MRVQTTLMFDTNSMEAMRFYQDQLGATVVMAMPQRQFSADGEGAQTTAIPRKHEPILRSRYAVSISTETAEEGERLFSALSAEGTVTIAEEADDVPHKTLVDKFGTAWTLLS